MNLIDTADADELFLKGDKLHDQGRYDEAFSVFVQGAESGDTSCMSRIACMYTCGEGVECDYDKAIEWELKAVELGDSNGMINIGITYRLKGEIVKSKHWFEKSLQSGDGAAALELAKLYMVSDKEINKVKEYLNIAVNSEPMSESCIEEANRLLSEVS